MLENKQKQSKKKKITFRHFSTGIFMPTLTEYFGLNQKENMFNSSHNEQLYSNLLVAVSSLHVNNMSCQLSFEHTKFYNLMNINGSYWFILAYEM